MNVYSTTFQSATVVTVPLIIPGRRKLLGVQLSVAMDGGASSYSYVQASTTGQSQNTSAGMEGVLAALYQVAVINAGAQVPYAQNIYVPLYAKIIIDGKVWVHLTTNATTYVHAGFYCE